MALCTAYVRFVAVTKVDGMVPVMELLDRSRYLNQHITRHTQRRNATALSHWHAATNFVPAAAHVRNTSTSFTSTPSQYMHASALTKAISGKGRWVCCPTADCTVRQNIPCQ